MTLLVPRSQEFFDSNDKTRGVVIGLHTLKLLSASDTFTVPTLADVTSGVSVKQLERAGDPTVTVTNSTFTVTIAGGAAGDEVMIVTVHQGNMNSNPEVAS